MHQKQVIHLLMMPDLGRVDPKQPAIRISSTLLFCFVTELSGEEKQQNLLYKTYPIQAEAICVGCMQNKVLRFSTKVFREEPLIYDTISICSRGVIRMIFSS